MEKNEKYLLTYIRYYYDNIKIIINEVILYNIILLNSNNRNNSFFALQF